VAASLGDRKLEPDLFVLSRELDPLQFFKHFDPALDLSRFRILVTESFNEPLCLVDFFLLADIGGFEDAVARLFFFQVVVVVP